MFTKDETPRGLANADKDPGAGEDELKGYDEVDRNKILKDERKRRKDRKRKWSHRGGDLLASLLAVGAYTYTGRGAGGATEIAACRKFCEENGLNYVVMERIQKMRKHLAKLAKTRLGTADGVAAKTGGLLVSMPPPNKLQENLLMQVGKHFSSLFVLVCVFIAFARLCTCFSLLCLPVVSLSFPYFCTCP